VASEIFVKNLDRVREISAHAVPSGAVAELLERVVNEYLLRHDPKLKAEPKAKSAKDENPVKKDRSATEIKEKKKENNVTSPETNHCVKLVSSRYIPADLKKMLWQKANGVCTYEHRDLKTNLIQRCCSKYGLEMEHILPFALGGTHELTNLTLRCRTHNQLAAKRFFGSRASGKIKTDR